MSESETDPETDNDFPDLFLRPAIFILKKYGIMGVSEREQRKFESLITDAENEESKCEKTGRNFS